MSFPEFEIRRMNAVVCHFSCRIGIRAKDEEMEEKERAILFRSKPKKLASRSLSCSLPSLALRSVLSLTSPQRARQQLAQTRTGGRRRPKRGLHGGKKGEGKTEEGRRRRRKKVSEKSSSFLFFRTLIDLNQNLDGIFLRGQGRRPPFSLALVEATARWHRWKQQQQQQQQAHGRPQARCATGSGFARELLARAKVIVIFIAIDLDPFFFDLLTPRRRLCFPHPLRPDPEQVRLHRGVQHQRRNALPEATRVFLAGLC